MRRFAYMGCSALFGALSERIARDNSMLLFCGLATFSTAPIMMALHDVSSSLAAGVLIRIALTIASLYTSISGLIKTEMFPSELHALGPGLSYVVANAACGGSAEYVALWPKSIQLEQNFYWDVTFMCALTWVVAWKIPDPSKVCLLT